ncbi:hypothetical protein LCGC14_2737270, partial [marine sediment metagenome]
DTVYNGGGDAFVAKVNGAGALLWASFLGGSEQDVGYAIGVDAAGDALIAGRTMSSNFPTPGGFDTSYSGGTYDGFVAKILAVTPVAGDITLNGKVDITDLGALAANWQASGPGIGWGNGDFNWDYVVDITDLGALAANWKSGVTAPLTADASDGQAEAVESATQAVEPLAEPINDGPRQTAAISYVASLTAEPDRRGGALKRPTSSDTREAADSTGIFPAAATTAADLAPPADGLPGRLKESEQPETAALAVEAPARTGSAALEDVDLLAGPALGILAAAI